MGADDEYYVPGYAGHCPGLVDKSVGKTYGQATREIINETRKLKTRLMPLKPDETRPESLVLEKPTPDQSDDDTETDLKQVMEEDMDTLKYLLYRKAKIPDRKSKEQSKKKKRENKRNAACSTEGAQRSTDTLSRGFLDVKKLAEQFSSLDMESWYRRRSNELMEYYSEPSKQIESRRLDGEVAAQVSNAKKYYNATFDDTYYVHKFFRVDSTKPTEAGETEKKGRVSKTGFTDASSTSKTELFSGYKSQRNTGLFSGSSPSKPKSISGLLSSKNKLTSRSWTSKPGWTSGSWKFKSALTSRSSILKPAMNSRLSKSKNKLLDNSKIDAYPRHTPGLDTRLEETFGQRFRKFRVIESLDVLYEE